MLNKQSVENYLAQKGLPKKKMGQSRIIGIKIPKPKKPKTKCQKCGHDRFKNAGIRSCIQYWQCKKCFNYFFVE